MSARQKKPGIDLGLEVIEAVRQPDAKLSLRDIAEVCGCTWQAIHFIEQSALRKLRRELSRRERGVPNCKGRAA